MKTLKFQGYSDDTFGLVRGKDFDNCGKNGPISCVIESGEFAQTQGVVVTGHYHLNPIDGCWTIGLSLLGEDADFPPWPIRFRKSLDVPYSPVLEIDVPDNVRLTWYVNQDIVGWEDERD